MSTTAPATVGSNPPAPGTTTAHADTSTTPGIREAVRRIRWPLVAVVALLLVAVVGAIGAQPGIGLLDTRSTSPQGSKALAEVLRGEGVPVTQVRTLDQAAATASGTLVVAGPDLLTPSATSRLAASGATTIVLVAATDVESIRTLVPTISEARVVDDAVRDAACDLPAATLAGPADLGGTTYSLERTSPDPNDQAGGPDPTGCYPLGGEPSLLVVDGAVPAAGGPPRTVALLGASTALQNDELAREGNAALALNLLGADGPITWYLPSLEDLYGADAVQQQWIDLVPRGVLWGLGWAAFAVVLLAAWRARRLGPVVTEPLPVVVRASETVEGRARLYRRSGDRGRAAALLRAATRDRIVPLLGLPVDAAPGAVVDSVAARTARAPVDVASLLYGAAPHDDPALVRLADELDRLDREVRHP